MDRNIFDRVDFRCVFDDFTAGVMAVDAQGIVTYYNRAISEIDGLESDFVLGKDLINAYGPEPLPSPMLTCLHTGKPILSFALSYTTVRGRYISVEQDSYPLRRNGKITGAIAFVRKFSQLSVTPPPVVSMVSTIDALRDAESSVNFANLVGASPAFAQAAQIARKSALTPSPVLLCGATGTGKELFARSIHSASPRKDKPFIGINCSAIPANLLEAVLFGTVKGAFTDAQDRDGLFIEAKGGTVFLDELDSMPVSLQPKLLRALQEKKIQRIGSSWEEKIDVKIISSIGSSPEEALAGGKLRADLFYRLGVVVIHIPPLKDRKDDLEALCMYFILKHNSKLGKNIQGISPEVLAIFKQYAWPGNVRELEHIIEGSMNLMYDEKIILPQMLPQFFYQSISFSPQKSKKIEQNDLLDETSPFATTRKHPAPALSLREQMVQQKLAEPEILRQALSKTFGSISAAAVILGLTRQTMTYKMKKHGLHKKDFQIIHL